MQSRNQKIIITTLLFLTFIFNFVSAQDLKKAVVKVTAENSSGSRNSTGFVWESTTGKRYIVTCLHGVIGANDLYYDFAAKELDIVKVDKESDLALLVPKSEEFSLKNLPALKLTKSEPSSKSIYKIYGFPAGVLTVQGDELKLSDTQHLVAMKDYLSNDNLGAVTQRGFPQKSFKVLRVSSGITPGHSGAPIINPADNGVIGIGSGGLSFVGFQRVNWAAPASYYLPRIESSGQGPETIKNAAAPKETKMQFSVSSGEGVARLNEATFYGTYTLPLYEVYDNLDSQIKSEISYLSKSYDYDFTQMVLDIYTDFNTGATIAVPTGIPLKTDGNKFMAQAPDFDTRMYVTVGETNSLYDSQTKIHNFDNYILSLQPWESKLNPDEEVPYEEKGWWEQKRFMVVTGYDDYENTTFDEHWLSADYSIEYDKNWADYVGVAVMSFNVFDMDHEDELLYQKMSICTMLSGFAIE